MRGLQHNVIEINDTDNERIEKILVFLRPGRQKIDVAGTRKDAQDILRKVRVHRIMPRLPEKVRTALLAAGAVIVSAVIIMLIF